MAEVSFFKPVDDKTLEIQRLRKYAEAMRSQSAQPQGTEVVSGFAVKQSPLAGLARALQSGMAGMSERSADTAEKEQSANRAKLMAQAMGVYSKDPQAAAAILGQDPALAADAMKMGMGYADEQRKNALDLQKAEKEAALKRDLANMRISGSAGGGTIDPETGAFIPTYSNKPLPAPALKMQNEALASMAGAKDISNNAKLLIDQVQNGQLELGPVENIISKGRNLVGLSNANSQNFANMNATLEKIRNDSLRLNKGVQTEGDAQRAFNEVLASLNDPVVFKNAMEKLNAINERGAELQRQMVMSTRENYNVAPYDFEKINSIQAGVNPEMGAAVNETPRDKAIRLMKERGATPEQIQRALAGK